MKPTIIPVIHIKTIPQVRANITTCLKHGVDKVFLIGTKNVISSFEMVKEEFNIWTGINFLHQNNMHSLDSISSLKYPIDALWSDNCDVDFNMERAIEFNENRSKFGFQYFGGVEFKYQPKPDESNLMKIYDDAQRLVDVITTSGPGTDQAIDVQKLQRSRTLSKDHPLAVASGISSDNIKWISKYANYFLVASSITDYRTELIIENKLIELIDNLN